jgi:hypothetical protein
VLALQPGAGRAFPPYRSTDAETAGPRTLEIRLGALRVERENGDNTYTSPLLRVNLGLFEHLELVSELEYSPEEQELDEGAVGFKAVTPAGPVHVGVETLALLPVAPEQSGAGVESQLLATWRGDPLRLHLNAGGFYDPRSGETERGWRASVLGEIETGRSRPGLELFARQVRSEPIQVQAGLGVILDLGAFDLRTALQAGLTSAAPDLVGSVWIGWKWRIARVCPPTP